MVLKTSFTFALSVLFFPCLFQSIFAQGRSVALEPARTAVTTDLNQSILKRSVESSSGTKPISPLSETERQILAPTTKRSITISDAVSIFLQRNLQLIAARYDIDSVDADKLTARLRPNPQISVGFSDIPLDFRENFVKPQTFSYGISQTLELGGKRGKRINP